MHYEINVSYKGSHFFATHERSLQGRANAIAVWRALKKAFPPPLYAITVSRIETTGTDVTKEML